MAGGYPTYNLSNFQDMNQMRKAKEALEVIQLAQGNIDSMNKLPLDKDLKKTQIRGNDLANTASERTLPGVLSGLTPWQDVLVGDMMSKRPQLIDVPGNPRTIGSYADPGSIPPPAIEDTFKLSTATPLGMAATQGLEVPAPQAQQVDVQVPGATTKALADVVTLPGTTTQYSPSTGMKWDAIQSGFKDLGGVPGTEKRAIQVNGQTQLVDQAKAQPVLIPGSTPKSQVIDGTTYEAPPPKWITEAPPKTYTDERGITYKQNPSTGLWDVIPQTALPKPAGAAKPTVFEKQAETKLAAAVIQSMQDIPTRLAALNNMKSLLNEGLATGPVEGAIGSVTSLTDEGQRSRREQFQSMAIEIAQTFHKAGQGSLSDRDVQLLLNIAPSLYKTEEGNKEIIARLEAAGRAIQARNEFIISATKNGGSALQAQDAWTQFMKANPISYRNSDGQTKIIQQRPTPQQWEQNGVSSATLEGQRLLQEADESLTDAKTTEEKERIKLSLKKSIENLKAQTE